MDKAETKKQPIKITFLEINPPLNELIKNKEEMNIIFQGNDNFYDFKKYLSSKIPITLNRYKKSLIMTLLKSNNIFATGLFTIRTGEQIVVFNYESKKRLITTKAVNINNLLDCIKIKISCEFDTKDKENFSTLNINNTVNVNKINDSASKYVPKVNLMKSSHLKSKNNAVKKTFEKKKKNLGNFYLNNSIKKHTLVNSSQEFSLGGEYNTVLTEEININNKYNKNLNTNEIKKLNPYCSIKTNNNLVRRTDTEMEMSAKVKGSINKAKSKNYFSTIKRQYKQNFGNQIKLNNSSLNLINQKNNLDTNENLDMKYNPNTNRILKPTISFNKNNKRNMNINKEMNNKNLINSIDNFIAGQIIEHVDMSKKDNKNHNNTNSEKKSIVNINKNISNIGGNLALNNENKIRKFNNNNITLNSISTEGTKKNELEYSINSLLDCKDYEDKNIINKNGLISNTNRLNNERLEQKLSGKNSINRNTYNHKFNKSLCQQSFIDKIFTENDLNLNVNESDKNNSYICKSFEKLKNENKELNNLNQDNKDNKIYENIENKENNDDKKEANESQEENIEFENYERIKEDFNLLYNEEYIKNINEDLLKLEIELFFEKMSELFSTYHLLMDEKILENQIIKRDYKKNISNYLLYDKLNNKLQGIKTRTQAKKDNLKEKGINLDNQNLKNININIDELNIFKIIFPEEDKAKRLKKIISIILKKQGNKELLDDKLKMLLK